MRVPPRTNWHPSDPNKSILADVLEQVIVCAQFVYDESIKHQKARRVPGDIACQCRCSYTGEGATFPVAFPGVRGGDCSHFGRAFQPFQQSLARPSMSGNCDCFIGTIRLFCLDCSARHNQPLRQPQ